MFFLNDGILTVNVTLIGIFNKASKIANTSAMLKCQNKLEEKYIG